MTNLTDIVLTETGAMVLNTLRSYRELLDLTPNITTKKQTGIRSKIKRIATKVDQAADHYMKSTRGDKIEFSLEVFKDLRASNKKLSQSMPSAEVTEDIINYMLSHLEKTHIGRIYDKIKKWTPGLAVVSGVAAAISAHVGVYLPAAIYAGSAFAGLREKVGKSSTFNVLATNALLWAGGVSYLFDKPVIEPGSTDAYLVLFSYFAHNLGLFPAYRAVQYFIEKKKYKATEKKLRKNRVNFDRFMKSGLAIEEAYKNLMYVQRVCDSDQRNRAEFEPQLEKLEEKLLGYVMNSVSYEEVLNARVKYFPKEVEKVKGVRPIEVSAPTKTYTADEYAAMKAEQVKKKSKKRKRMKKKVVVEDPVEDLSSVLSITFQISDELKDKYAKSADSLMGYGIVPVLDVTRSKLETMGSIRLNEHDDLRLEHFANVSLIRSKAPGIHLLDKLHQKHEIPENAVVYKFQPIGPLRAIFFVQDQTVKVLEVLSHPEYDKWLKA